MRSELDVASILPRAKLIGIVRSATPVDLVQTCQALFAGGVRCLEVTLNSPGALAAIERVRADLPADCVIGAGTVLDVESATHALAAGAQFLVMPVVDAATIAFARSRGTPIIPGAFTPSEIFTAWRAGATLVKLFPASSLGVAFVREVLAPMPDVRLIPTGSVTLENVHAWFEAGVTAVGVGTALMPREALTGGDWDTITARARVWAKTLGL